MATDTLRSIQAVASKGRICNSTLSISTSLKFKAVFTRAQGNLHVGRGLFFIYFVLDAWVSARVHSTNQIVFVFYSVNA